MTRRGKNSETEGALDLIERAVHLLRAVPLQTMLLFQLGAIPYLLGILFFLADMSASPFAGDRCAGAALGVGLLYIWMRTWQAFFCQRLSSFLMQAQGESITPRRFLRMYRFHAIYSSWALVLVPFSAIVAIPFGWIYAYFNNLCIVDPTAGRESTATARSMAMPMPLQNHTMVAVVVGFAYFVVLNLITVLALAPGLLKSLLGVETEFARSWYWLGNTTFLAIVVGLAYLVVEPLVKAVYVLRFHACQSIETGEDLMTDLKRIPPRRRAAGMVRTGLMALLLFGTTEQAKAWTTCTNENTAQSEDACSPPFRVPGNQETIDSSELDESVDRVMKNREFTWRMPREFVESDEEKGFFGTFMDSVFTWMESTAKSIGEAFERFLEWLGDRFTPSHQRKEKSSGLDPAFFKGLSVLLLIILLGVLVVFLVRAFLVRRAPPPKLEEAEMSTIKLDLDDENVIATMLAEDEWIAMARELSAQGDLRKAMRAWFLAGLALLSRKELLAILHSKSNLDYCRELDRRARRCPDVVPVFGENIALFERAWYGLHPATAEDVGLLEHNMERLRHGVEA
ncbi:hypothetical protein PDESU_02890 [Pontiella desulfatans]|uniref:Protein-glutamine gamma-glutamyltransferase-like C-terminal domain-containing protein n=1 Tax=Pontiella desulfatans TaxID=2750659 RepID=A0A6C2U461_PONDE|nr:DUF4129 domain-containing protein [Pontiella desulfatans]VGO14331.1 hypothetical protein PDESU_02890 [Pontiella desulfatans]